MLVTRAAFPRSTLHIRRFYSSQHVLPSVPTIAGPLDLISVEEFRTRAFTPEKPLLIKAGDGQSAEKAGVKSSPCAIQSADKWFIREAPSSGNVGDSSQQRERRAQLSQTYLSPFASTILPYELITPSKEDLGTTGNSELSKLLKHYTQYSDGTTFHRFSAPLSLFLLAVSSKSPSVSPPQLYIAQAQLLDLPPTLRADLPTPHLVLQAGKGDIYDSNLWLGIPPTYTPLHKDPNPNLFIQLASQKGVRLFEPRIGAGIFRDVQERMGRAGYGGGGAMRGNEMMEGPEREGLFDAVWGRGDRGFEAVVGPGDALFIPRGWWHSFRSVEEGVTVSVNWWFR